MKLKLKKISLFLILTINKRKEDLTLRFMKRYLRRLNQTLK